MSLYSLLIWNILWCLLCFFPLTFFKSLCSQLLKLCLIFPHDSMQAVRFWQIPWRQCCFHVLYWPFVRFLLWNLCSNFLRIFMLDCLPLLLICRSPLCILNYNYIYTNFYTHTYICQYKFTCTYRFLVTYNGKICLSEILYKWDIIFVRHTYIWHILYIDVCVYV